MKRNPEITDLPTGWYERSGSSAGRVIIYEPDEEGLGYVTEVYDPRIGCKGFIFTTKDPFPSGEKLVVRGVPLAEAQRQVEEASEKYRQAYLDTPRTKLGKMITAHYPIRRPGDGLYSDETAEAGQG